MRKIVHRIRAGEYPQVVPINQIVIEGRWARTADAVPQNFMVHDNQNNGQRLIMFCSPQCLQTLSAAHTWYMDGNFRIAPREFSQLYIIRAELGENAVTVAYALLQTKSQQCYTEMLEELCNSCIANGNAYPQVTSIHCDFEIAMHQAVRQVFPNTAIRGCFYHLTQVSYTYIVYGSLRARQN